MATVQGTDERIAEVVAIEKALLGGMLLDERIIPEAMSKLEPGDFYLPPQQRIYSAIIEAHAAGEPVNFLSIHDRIGGPFHMLTDLYDCALPGHVVYFANKILDASARRRAQAMLHEALIDIGQSPDVEAQYARISEGFVEMLRGRSRVQKVGDVLKGIVKNLDNQTPPDIIRTGFPSLDGMVGGLRGGVLWIIAGRTSMGKSAFAMNLSRGVGLRAGKAVLYCALEDGNAGLATRLLANESDVAMGRLAFRDFRDSDFAKLVLAHGHLTDTKLYLLDNENSWAKIRGQIKLTKMTDASLGVVFIDYLGLIRAAGFKDRYEQMTYLSQECKRLALELDIAVVALCQINRQTEGRKDHRPGLGDLRDSGALEQDGDVILLLYRPHYYDKTKDVSVMEIAVAKNRNGPTGSIELKFDPPTFKFTEG